MDVASLELCRELYELSGWSDTDFIWETDGEVDFFTHEDTAHHTFLVSAYDLGYLLRKLQPVLHMIERTDFAVMLHNIPWRLDPENAAARLAIELFKQGVLVRSES